jgi:sugar phosphate isomerase/epimerase
VADGVSRFRTGLNPYGLTYHLGLQGHGTARANPDGRGLEGFIALGAELGARVLEIFDPWLAALSDDDLRALKERLAGLGIEPVVSGGLITADADSVFRSARLLGAGMIRFVLTNVLCGDRAAREDWADLRAAAARAVTTLGRRAADQGIMIAIENHQDFTSAEMVEFCGLGPGVGLTYDTGNSFPVAEAPLDFTRIVAPHVRHLHLKDYRVQFTREGIRLVRCAIGDGAIPFAEIFALLGEHHDSLTAVLEPGALEARHVRLFTPGWWRGYPQRSAPALAACLLAAQRNRLGEEDDFRTPWERKADGEVADYELAMIRRSAANMRNLGVM